MSLADSGSFRDPAGAVFFHEGRVFRALSAQGYASLRPVLDSGLLTRWSERGVAVGTVLVEDGRFGGEIPNGLPFEVAGILEHDLIDHVSYPYEWPFALLKKAALLHLDLQIEALDEGFSFSDSSAFNVQFDGSKPILMDVLSLRPYQEGEYWAGYRQFCEQFLNPLLLTARTGIPHCAWYRGALHGIGTQDIASVLPMSSRFSINALLHVFLHARLIRTAHRLDDVSVRRSRWLTRPALRAMLSGMRSWVVSLKPKGIGDSFWADYETRNSYAPEETHRKRDFVGAYVREVEPRKVIDIGCNSGDYSELVLANGAQSVVGYDLDHGALAAAVSRAEAKNLAFLPLFLDVSNPSPDQGWQQAERKGFAARANADGMVALALIHHMVIGSNIPLAQAVRWLSGIAPTGVIEFVPKEDPMVQGMLRNREDIFSGYSIEAFRQTLGNHADIVRETVVGESGRTLFQYRGRH